MFKISHSERWNLIEKRKCCPIKSQNPWIGKLWCSIIESPYWASGYQPEQRSEIIQTIGPNSTNDVEEWAENYRKLLSRFWCNWRALRSSHFASSIRSVDFSWRSFQLNDLMSRSSCYNIIIQGFGICCKQVELLLVKFWFFVNFFEKSRQAFNKYFCILNLISTTDRNAVSSTCC